LFEEAHVALDIEEILGGLDKVPGRFNMGKEAMRLERRRSYGKKCLEKLGIPVVPVIKELNLLALAPGELDQIEEELRGKGVEKIYAKYDNGPNIAGGDIGTVFSRLAIEHPHTIADHEGDAQAISTCGLCLQYALNEEQQKSISPELSEQRRKEAGDVILEPLLEMSAEDTVEFSICMLANGQKAFGVCTLMDLENKLFHGRMGPKISDVSQVNVPSFLFFLML
jgi:hypothetical protein